MFSKASILERINFYKIANMVFEVNKSKNIAGMLMLKFIKKCLLQGKYAEAKKMCFSIDQQTVRDMLMKIAYDTENISVYSFIQYMIKETNSIFWIELAIDVMINPLCFIEGAYSVALFYSREMLSKDKNIKNLERMLFFYNIPEKLVDEGEAEFIVGEILKIEPNNQVALEVRSKIGMFKS